MSFFKLDKTRLFEGVWEGVLTPLDADADAPDLGVTHLDKTVPGLQLVHNQDAGHWAVRIPIPIQLVGDGAQTFIIFDKQSGETLDSFTVIAGDAVSDDIRAEVDLLRAELDMLKRAFRRHCVETV